MWTVPDYEAKSCLDAVDEFSGYISLYLLTVDLSTCFKLGKTWAVLFKTLIFFNFLCKNNLSNTETGTVIIVVDLICLIILYKHETNVFIYAVNKLS